MATMSDFRTHLAFLANSIKQEQMLKDDLEKIRVGRRTIYDELESIYMELAAQDGPVSDQMFIQIAFNYYRVHRKMVHGAVVFELDMIQVL